MESCPSITQCGKFACSFEEDNILYTMRGSPWLFHRTWDPWMTYIFFSISVSLVCGVGGMLENLSLGGTEKWCVCMC